MQSECSEVCTREQAQQAQHSPIQTDYARLLRCLLYGKQEQFNLFNVTGLYWHFACER